MIRILLVDDRPSVRDGLRMRLALEPDLLVVGDAADGLEALNRARNLSPDVVVMDIEMPRMDGLAATEALRLIEPWCKVIILSIHDDAQTHQCACAAGAAAFVTKQAGDAALLAAIRAAAPDRKG